MIISQEIVIPERKEMHQVAIVCDLCGLEKKTQQSNWSSRYDVAEVEIELSVGSRWPECGDLQLTSFQICPACFTNKLMPWMISQGANPTVRKIEY